MNAELVGDGSLGDGRTGIFGIREIRSIGEDECNTVGSLLLKGQWFNVIFIQCNDDTTVDLFFGFTIYDISSFLSLLCWVVSCVLCG